MRQAVSDKEQKSEEKGTRQSALWEWVKTILYAVILALFIRAYFFATFHVPTGSMEPTLYGAQNHPPGDRLIALKFIYGFPIPFTGRRVLAMSEPHRGDVIIFNSKGIEGLDPGKDFIKRLVGLGGERLRIVPEKRNGSAMNFFSRKQGRIYINGEPLEEPGPIAERRYYIAGPYGNYEVTIPPDHYYMLGDNVESSRDSRFWGFVPHENVVGKAVFIYWPPSRMGLIE
jgi:signal peptidase I